MAALLATLTTEIGEQATAQAAYDAAVLADAANADNAADAAALSALVADAKAKVDALYASIIVDTDTPFDGTLNVNALDVANLASAVAAADAARVAASALVVQLGVGHAEYADAQAIEASAIALDDAMEALDPALGDSAVSAADGAALVAAQASANGNVSPAASLASDLNAMVGLGDVATTLAALNSANSELAAAQLAYDTANGAAGVATAADEALAATLTSYGIEYDSAVGSHVGGLVGSLVIPNLSPDIGLSPGFNSWMTFFGQFFDHGLDLVTKGGNGTVYVPLQADDPLIAGVDGAFGTADDLPAHLRFMALTRATARWMAAQENTTTSFVDQNQTYTSDPSHQVFLREYVMTATVRGQHWQDAGWFRRERIGGWRDRQLGRSQGTGPRMLGISLSDFDVHSAPCCASTNTENSSQSPSGYAQMTLAAGVDGMLNKRTTW